MYNEQPDRNKDDREFNYKVKSELKFHGIEMELLESGGQLRIRDLKNDIEFFLSFSSLTSRVYCFRPQRNEIDKVDIIVDFIKTRIKLMLEPNCDKKPIKRVRKKRKNHDK